MAPVSLVLLTAAVEPVLVLIMAMLLPLIWRAAPRERLTLAHLVQKSGAIVLTGWGSYILLSVPTI
jgi:fumarate reductase subunit D